MTDELKPDIATIAEANYHEDLSSHMNKIQGYKAIRTLDSPLTKFSRLVVLIKDDLKYELLNHLMESEIATVWIKIPRKGKTPLIIGCLYREHKLIHKPDLIETSLEIQQVNRWGKILPVSLGTPLSWGTPILIH